MDDASLEFHTNMITGIIGPNGAGKTTFINMISGDVVPSSGHVSISNEPIPHTAFRFARHGIARTFQNIRIFPRMTVMENVVVAARQVEPNLVHAEATAMRELQRMGLADVADRTAAGLAYGLRRRLEIARALVLKPRFLLLDEPAAGMNAVETAELIAILAEIRKERQIGIILIEHDMRLVMGLCERIVVIDHGKVIADGLPTEVQKTRMSLPLISVAAALAPDTPKAKTKIITKGKNKMSKHNYIQRSMLAASVCALAIATASTAKAEEIIIGVATAQTGGLAPYDQPSLAGFRMAIDEINAKGGLGGKYQAKLIIKDTRTDTAQTATVAQELIDAGAKVMITPCDADASIAAGQLTQPLNIPTLTFCGTAPILSVAVGDVMFGTYPADNVQATAVADFALSEGKNPSTS